ncbi:ABC transporter substrate-binding protein [Paenibacillus allorhizosphaerae]|uniref:Extracellular solute-binding protein n=1 Tax=Paenibacillus allorhizosphaerae TaxID=2849866 RepID=A0ABM8VAB4_9BACL|nr:extracellular solute-binding protein [Paenibacillus allorhizosphaerae]CAG7616038.1 hypothetical protein PAECIP111802_00240 [Paenibacillus allorhizosphaerae]
MRKRIAEHIASVSLIAVFATGCLHSSNPSMGKSNVIEGKEQAVDVSKPTTVKIMAGNMNDQLFNFMIAEPMTKKYPQITVQKLQGKLSELIVAGETPDLITDWNGGVPSYQQYDLLTDMTDLVKKHNLDLGRFQNVYIDAIKRFSEKGELYAIPYYAQLNALYYNKDLFDKFGVPYPKDGMTWEEVIDLGARMTRMEGDVQIQGLNYGGVQRLAFPFSPDIVNAKTGKATVNNDVWKNALQYALRIDSIPGNRVNKDFMKGQVAMFPNVGDSLPNIKKAVEEGTISLGIAQYPQFKEAPNTYGMVDAHYIFLTKTSRNQDAAMKVIEVLTSDEVQMAAAKTYARLSPLKDPELQKQFATKFLPGVDLQPIFKSKPAAGQIFSKYYPQSRDIVFDEYKQVADGKKDINTALRSAEDRINKLVADDMAVTK